MAKTVADGIATDLMTNANNNCDTLYQLETTEDFEEMEHERCYCVSINNGDEEHYPQWYVEVETVSSLGFNNLK